MKEQTELITHVYSIDSENRVVSMSMTSNPPTKIELGSLVDKHLNDSHTDHVYITQRFQSLPTHSEG